MKYFVLFLILVSTSVLADTKGNLLKLLNTKILSVEQEISLIEDQITRVNQQLTFLENMKSVAEGNRSVLKTDGLILDQQISF